MKLRKVLIEQNHSFSVFIEQNYYQRVTVVEDKSKKLWLTEAAIMKVIKEFQGIVTAVVLDKEISNGEIDLLYEWRDYRKDFLVKYPLIQFNKLLAFQSDDARYSDEFKKELFEFVDKFALRFGQNVIQGVYDQPDSIPIEGMEFVLTGTFMFGEKSQIADLIIEREGVVSKTVHSGTNYLIVGSKGNKNYSFGNFGHKIKVALELQNAHRPIIILEENYFLEKIGVLP